MKDDIRNIINLESITRVRNSMETSVKLPEKNSIVKLVPLECLEQGVKVLIDGKLFIAFINEKIPLKEEIIALVLDTNPFTLSLELSSQLVKNKEHLIDQVTHKLDLPNTNLLRKIIIQVIEEGNILVKSKILVLSELLSYLKVNGLEFSLLINLVWCNREQNRDFIEDLYYHLFDEKFEDVCENLFESVGELLFINLPQYIIKNIRETLLYNDLSKNLSPLVNKFETISEIIKMLNDYNVSKHYINDSIDKFINYGVKYILQKSLLKEYDYYPDFVMIEKDASLIMVNYCIKKIINNHDEVSYKVEFKNKNLPFKLTGMIKDKLLVGVTEIDESVFSKEEIESFSNGLYNNWGIRSDLRLNNKNNERLLLPKLDVKINKLVS